MRIVFMGTPDFAVPSLMALLDHHQVVAVVTQPDRPKGRGRKVEASPVKRVAVERGVRVLQPERVRDGGFISTMRELAPEAVVVVAFGQKIPPEILELPRFGCINVHASLLPKYRGAAPIQWAMMNGERETGVTTMLMDEGWDTGDILLQKRVIIQDDMDAGKLHDILAVEGARLLLDTLSGLEAGTIAGIPQDESQATWAPRLDPEMARIQWDRPARDIRNLIRAMSPRPGAYTCLGDTRIKVFGAEVISDMRDIPGVAGIRSAGEPGRPISPGEVLVMDDRAGIVVATGGGFLALTEVQAEGSRRMSAQEFVRGYWKNKQK
ncbi:MAG TPA: methionyl-tRNA formyltransferase [Firmicutes bacterium]|nr:methionyl-tRNA formyltransferase [Bacillota bacterium]